MKKMAIFIVALLVVVAAGCIGSSHNNTRQITTTSTHALNIHPIKVNPISHRTTPLSTPETTTKSTTSSFVPTTTITYSDKFLANYFEILSSLSENGLPHETIDPHNMSSLQQYFAGYFEFLNSGLWPGVYIGYQETLYTIAILMSHETPVDYYIVAHNIAIPIFGKYAECLGDAFYSKEDGYTYDSIIVLTIYGSNVVGMTTIRSIYSPILFSAPVIKMSYELSYSINGTKYSESATVNIVRSRELASGTYVHIETGPSFTTTTSCANDFCYTFERAGTGYAMTGVTAQINLPIPSHVFYPVYCDSNNMIFIKTTTNGVIVLSFKKTIGIQSTHYSGGIYYINDKTIKQIGTAKFQIAFPATLGMTEIQSIISKLPSTIGNGNIMNFSDDLLAFSMVTTANGFTSSIAIFLKIYSSVTVVSAAGYDFFVFGSIAYINSGFVNLEYLPGDLYCTTATVYVYNGYIVTTKHTNFTIHHKTIPRASFTEKYYEGGVTATLYGYFDGTHVTITFTKKNTMTVFTDDLSNKYGMNPLFLMSPVIFNASEIMAFDKYGYFAGYATGANYTYTGIAIAFAKPWETVSLQATYTLYT